MKKRNFNERVNKNYTRQEKIKQYLDSCLKTNKKVTSTSNIAINTHVDNRLISVLNNCKIIILNNENSYVWNSKIPNTHKLSETIVLKLDECYSKYPSRQANKFNLIEKKGFWKRIWEAIKG